MNAAEAVANAELASDGLRGLEAKTWLRRIEDQHQDLESAFGWLLDHGRHDDALRIAIALYDFWRLTGRAAEGRSWIDRALRGGPSGKAMRASALYRLGLLAFWQGDDAAATSSFEESLDLARQLKDPTATAVALAAQARVALRADNLEEAHTLCVEALEAVEGTDDKDGRSNALHVLGVTAQMQGNLVEARDRMTQRLELAREQGNFGGAAGEANNLSHVERRLGNPARAEELAVEALDIAVRRGDEWMIPYALNALAACAVEAKQFIRAAHLLAAAAQMVERQGAAWPPDEAPLFEQSKQAAAHALGPTEFEVIWSAGRAMETSGIVAYALDRVAPLEAE